MAEQQGGCISRSLVLTAPPNPNGNLHLGHLAGPILSADAFMRHERLLGREAYFLLGTDDNQSWTASMAAQLGDTPQGTADRFAEKIDGTLKATQVDVEIFYRPNASPHHRQIVEETVERLHAAGHLIPRDAPTPFCTTCDTFLFEVALAGGCPHCKTPTYGNGCENCGLPNDCVDLIDPTCKACGGTPESRPLRRLYFPLEPHRAWLEEYLAVTPMPSQQRAQCQRLMEAELLLEVASSHKTDWGIPVPLEGFSGQCVSAWLEMAPGYLAATKQLCEHLGSPGEESWLDWWRGGDSQVVLFFGSDNCWNHTLFYPALLHALDPSLQAPQAFVSNQLYRLEGQKFSTSRGHAIWGDDLVAESSADVVRFYLAYTAPEHAATNFSMAAFRAFVHNEMEGTWQGWLHDLGTTLQEDYGGLAPESGAWGDRHHLFQQQQETLLLEARAAFAAATFSLQKATRIACELVRLARNFGEAEAVWRQTLDAPGYGHTATALELAAARTLVLLTAPLMPEFAERLWRALGYQEPIFQTGYLDQAILVPSGQRVDLATTLFFPDLARQIVAQSA